MIGPEHPEGASCVECGEPILLDAHWAHERWCDGTDICVCDLYAHAGCCTDPGCRPVEVPGQLTFEEAS